MADRSDRFHPAVDSVAMEIVTRLSPMCMQLDPLEEQLSMLSLGGRGQQAVTNHLVHLVMHSHWTVLSVFYRLVPVSGKFQNLFSSLDAGTFIPVSIPQCTWELHTLGVGIVYCLHINVLVGRTDR